jgi:hypothetical protein
MVIGGFFRIDLPRTTIAIGNTIYGSQAAIVVVAVIALAVGSFLSYKGYSKSPIQSDVRSLRLRGGPISTG